MLSCIQSELQLMADSASSILKLDIEIIDINLRRIACTGYARPLVGDYLTPSGVLNQAFFQQKKKSTAIEHPGIDERCIHCPRYMNCPWMGAIYSSIRRGNEPVGIFGITATNHSQADYLNSHAKELSQFADSYAELLSGYTQFHHYFKTTRHKNAEQNSSLCSMPSDDPLPNILSSDPKFLMFKEKVALLAGYTSTILLTGETGTGKELFARGIHTISQRRDGPYVPINCGAIPENLIESELFGYKKGAFTGATADKQGRFLSANHGTLFLDEVENMPIYLQQKLLRVLESREVEPLGASHAFPVDLRVVAATNRPLPELVRLGMFREDLFHRLNVIALTIPPLRERGMDILYLSQHLIDKYNHEFGKSISGLDDEVEKIFLSYPWRGNVRELQNTIEYAVCMCSGELITQREMPEHVSATAFSACTICEPHRRDAFPADLLQPKEVSEAKKISDALSLHGWSECGRINAAAELGISRATLYRKIKKYGLKREVGTEW